MTIKEKNPAPPPEVNRYPLVLDIYGRSLSVVMLLLGLRQWAIIMGVIAGAGGMFEAMSTPWQIVTMHLAVIDLVAAIGLWMRGPWGNVLWIYAALSEIVFHTVFSGTFGGDLTIVAFHVLTISAFLAIVFLARRAEPQRR
jgi:hypothetical protein